VNTCFVNAGPVRIQYKWLVPIHVFQEMKLRGLVIKKKRELYALSPNFHIHVSASDLHIPIPNRHTDPGNILIAQ
jgi:hypothetical protein